MRRVVSASLLRLVSGSAVAYAYFVFWACAPLSVVAPMVPWDQQNGWDVGGAVSAGATRTAENVYVENDNGALEIVGQEQQIASALGAQVWAVQDVGRVDLGMTIGGAGVSRIGSALRRDTTRGRYAIWGHL